MKERIINDNLSGKPSLKVYPHLKDSDPTNWMGFAGHVEALCYYDEQLGRYVWGVCVNIAYQFPMARQQSDELISAIYRCWQWIKEQPK